MDDDELLLSIVHPRRNLHILVVLQLNVLR